ncbi:MAG: hypothetical protein DRI71_09895 [Bacteroidetes bacterium]|nr:MAG: hypothetical protein DRI71_09895 [Bacteroidota bacterium]
MKQIRNLTLLFLVAIALQGCYSTSISASWMSEAHHPRNFKKLMVIGMSTNVAARATFEDELVYYMRLKGINAVAASSVMPPDRALVNESPEVQKKRLVDEGFDGVFAISLLEKNESTKYVYGSNDYMPTSFYGGYYGSFYSYYPHMYSNVYQPGYYAASTEIIMNSSLFDVESGELLWSAQSDTSDPSSVDDAAHSYAKSMITQILKRKIIIPNNTKK